jgi:uncharacterized protein
VHQDGLVHVSQLADRYVADANQVVRVGQKVRVTVQSVDLARGRIALTMKREGGERRGGAGRHDRRPAEGEGARAGAREAPEGAREGAREGAGEGPRRAGVRAAVGCGGTERHSLSVTRFGAGSR